MAEITITKKLSELQEMIDKVKRVYYSATANPNYATLAALDIELPILEDSFNYDSGAVSISSVKLTTGQKWAGYVTAGDSDISMQVASIAGSISDMFLNKKGDAITATVASPTLNGLAFSGQGYSTETKKVTGSLLMASEDGTRLFALPNVEMYANYVQPSGTPGYFNVQIQAKPNTDGADIVFITADTPPA